MSEKILRITVDARGARKELRSLSKELSTLKKSGTATSNRIDGMSKSFTGLGKSIAGLGLAVELNRLVRAGSKMESMNSRLSLVTNDLSGELSYLGKTAKRLNTDYEGLTDSYGKMLLLVDSGAISLKQARILTEGLGSAAVVTGTSAAELSGGFRQLNQALAGGVFPAEEFSSVSESLPGLMNKIEQSAGLASGELRKMMLAGELTSDIFIRLATPALEAFEVQAESMSGTFAASNINMTSELFKLRAEISKPINSSLVPVIHELTDAMSYLNENSELVETSVKGVGIAIGLATSAKALAGVRAMAGSLAAMTAASGPLGLLAAGLLASGAGAAYLYSELDGSSDALGLMSNASKDLTASLTTQGRSAVEAAQAQVKLAEALITTMQIDTGGMFDGAQLERIGQARIAVQQLKEQIVSALRATEGDYTARISAEVVGIETAKQKLKDLANPVKIELDSEALALAEREAESLQKTLDRLMPDQAAAQDFSNELTRIKTLMSDRPDEMRKAIGLLTAEFQTLNSSVETINVIGKSFTAAKGSGVELSSLLNNLFPEDAKQSEYLASMNLINQAMADSPNNVSLLQKALQELDNQYNKSGVNGRFGALVDDIGSGNRLSSLASGDDKRLNSINAQEFGAEEKESQRFEEQLLIAQEYALKNAESKSQANTLIQQAEIIHQQKLTEIHAIAQNQRALLERQQAQEQISRFGAMQSTIFSLFQAGNNASGKESKKSFERNKKASIANAYVSSGLAIANAWTSMPSWTAAAQAAYTLRSTQKVIKGIKATTYKGGSALTSGSGGSSSGGSAGSVNETANSSNSESQQIIQINNYGTDYMDTDKVDHQTTLSLQRALDDDRIQMRDGELLIAVGH